MSKFIVLCDFLVWPNDHFTSMKASYGGSSIVMYVLGVSINY